MRKLSILFLILLSFTILKTYAQYPDPDPDTTTSIALPTVNSNQEKNINKSKWTAALRMESYQPIGKASLTSTTSYDLSSIGQNTLPTFSLGYMSAQFLLNRFLTNIGTELMASYSDQSFNSVASSIGAFNGQFEVSTLSIRPFARFQWDWPKLYTRVHAELGSTQLNLTSQNSSLHLAKYGTFLGYGLGLSYEVNPSFDILAEYLERRGLETSMDWSPSMSSLQFGFLYKW